MLFKTKLDDYQTTFLVKPCRLTLGQRIKCFIQREGIKELIKEERGVKRWKDLEGSKSC